MAAAHRRAPDGALTHHRGHIHWPRFSLVFIPALLSLALLAFGAATGVVPVALAVEGKQGVQVTAKSFDTEGTATFPQFFQTQDGEHRTLVAVTLKNLKVQGLCVSTKVNTPVGHYVLRITSPDSGSEIKAGDVTIGVDTIDSLGFDGEQVRVNYGAKTPDGTPTDTGSRGFVPLEIDNLGFDLDLTIRWVVANQIHLNGLTLAGGLEQHECK
ncbi:MAG TPA: DUF6230 family protein [Pseudonocardia sp.]